MSELVERAIAEFESKADSAHCVSGWMTVEDAFRECASYLRLERERGDAHATEDRAGPERPHVTRGAVGDDRAPEDWPAEVYVCGTEEGGHAVSLREPPYLPENVVLRRYLPATLYGLAELEGADLRIELDLMTTDRNWLKEQLEELLAWVEGEIRKIDDVARDWGEKEFPAGEAQAYSYVAERIRSLMKSEEG